MTQPLALADPREPAISVLLVTYGAWTWTERCLAALFETTDVPYELICVDNASADGSADRLASMPGVRLVRNRINLGYGVAANLAALRARAPYLLLLNTDAIVQPGWLEPLRTVLDEDDDVAAVSARLLHLDGRLQEAGSIIWGDGMTDCYGDGDDAQRPEYRFRRDIDYASAACLLVRRAAFLDAGGFDPIYRPAYHEDTDLAMRWRTRGMRVVYQPFSTAVHKRWASSGDRSETEQLVARHRPIFLGRWRALIGARPERPAPYDSRAVTAVRDAECGERLLAVVDDDLASPGCNTTVQALLNLGGPQAPWRRSLLCREGEGETAAAQVLRGRGVEVVGTDHLAWLRARQHHYTCVLAPAALGGAMVRELRDTQPFAAGAVVSSSVSPDGNDPQAWARTAQVAICAGEGDALRMAESGPGIPLVRLDQPAALERIARLACLRCC
ncbi:MAG: hypothetical protein NVSMB29_01610 [Candidatus Dormibacteria bacterium]